jgi:uncharacterized protein (TIGR03435 family)
MRWRILGIILASLLGVAVAQTSDKSLTFEVASVKPAEMPKPDAGGRIEIKPPSGGPGTNDPGRIHYPFTSLRGLITAAFDMKPFQIYGPDFLDSERFDVTATMPPNTTKEQFRVMLQNLLADRFKMTFHRESRDLPMYSLTVAKGGPKLKESAPAAPPADPSAPASPPPLPPPPTKIAPGPDGFPDLPLPPGPRLAMIMFNGRAKLSAREQTMQDLATRMSTMLAKPVTDNTGLTAKYDFTLIFTPEGIGPGGPSPMPGGGLMVAAPPPAPPPPGAGRGDVVPGSNDEPLPTLFAALQQQVGLRLDQKKGPVDVIVIDHLDKTPTEN